MSRSCDIITLSRDTRTKTDYDVTERKSRVRSEWRVEEGYLIITRATYISNDTTGYTTLPFVEASLIMTS